MITGDAFSLKTNLGARVETGLDFTLRATGPLSMRSDSNAELTSSATLTLRGSLVNIN